MVRKSEVVGRVPEILAKGIGENVANRENEAWEQK
jgi:hypothetical protein